MNILILNWRDIKNPKSGGAEIVTLEHAKGWVEKGHKVTWFTSRFESSPKKEILNGVSIVRRGNYLTVYFFAPLFYLFSHNKFDLVIDEIHGIPFFTPLYVRRSKIAFIHEVAREIWDYMFPFPVNKIGKFIEPLYFRIYKNVRFWTDADSTSEDLERYKIKKNNITVINCPIENEVLLTLPKKEKTPTFIFVSRVVKMKGIEDVVSAFFYILRKMPDATLWIVGDGDQEYVESLRERMRKYSISPKVEFFGKVSEKKKLQLLSKATLLLHASVKEGWGIVVIEAASQATPAVVYNVTGLKDSVKDGKTGIVLKQNSPKNMAEEAIKLIDDRKKYKTYQSNALSWAKSLTVDQAVRQSLKMIEKLTKNEN